MNVQNNLNIITLSPPLILPTIYITVKVGQTVNITRAIINSATPYYQPQNAPIGSLYLKNYEGDFEVLFAENNKPQTIAYFTNNGARVYAISQNGDIFNSYVPYDVINNEGLRIIGVKVGQSTVTYVASAHNGVYESLSTTNIIGRIVVKVVSIVNSKPSNLSGGTQDVVIGSMTPIENTTISYQYVDPENDAPYKVKIEILPTKGTLLYMGQPVTIGQEILYQSVLAGMLVYKNDDTISIIGDVDRFNHTISDTGSEEYF